MSRCLFCQISSKEIPSKEVYEDSIIYAFEDINPKAPVHILIVPKKHIESIAAITEEDKEIILNAFIAANEIAGEKGIIKSGFRIVTNCGDDAGQSVSHLHFHLMGGRHMGWPPG
ncbi:MAG: histidine triad nucleotide-binding protein [Nitrospirota bacterium]